MAEPVEFFEGNGYLKLDYDLQCHKLNHSECIKNVSKHPCGCVFSQEQHLVGEQRIQRIIDTKLCKKHKLQKAGG